MERPAASRMRGVVVRDAAGVALALRVAAALGRRGPLPLVSPPGAAAWLGAPLFLAQIAAGVAALAAVPEGGRPDRPAPRPGPAPDPDPWPVLDCGLAAGHALAALRAGVAAVVLSPDCPAFPALAALAPGRVLPAAPPALDPDGLDPGWPDTWPDSWPDPRWQAAPLPPSPQASRRSAAHALARWLAGDPAAQPVGDLAWGAGDSPGPLG